MLSRQWREAPNYENELLNSKHKTRSLHVSNPIHKSAGKDCAFGEDQSGVSPQKRRWTQTEGSPLPLGAIWIEEEQAFNFAVYAEHAESVTLLLYCAEELVNPILTFPFDFVLNKSGRIWHCRLPLNEMRGARYYAYSVSGQVISELAI